MLRIVLVVLWIAVVVYAVADWARTSEDDMPGRLPRMMWLLIILLTAPTFALGAVAWTIARLVMRAENQHASTDIFEALKGGFNRNSRASKPSAPTSPDDDPDFLFKLQRDIQRQRANNAEQANHPTPGSSHDPQNTDISDEAEDDSSDAESPDEKNRDDATQE